MFCPCMYVVTGVNKLGKTPITLIFVIPKFFLSEFPFSAFTQLLLFLVSISPSAYVLMAFCLL